MQCPKPVKEKKERKKPKPKPKTDIRKVIIQIDSIDSDICLLTNNFVCMLCGGVASQTHHFFHKNNYGVLRFEPNNHCPLCYSCHIRKIHSAGDTEPLREKIIDRIRKEAFDDMRERGRGLAERSMPYLRACLSVKQSHLLQTVERASDSTLSMMSAAAKKRLKQVKKKFNVGKIPLDILDSIC